MSGEHQPAGLQNERTALAWQRTALSLVAGAAALTRLTYSQLGPAALVCIGLALPFGGWIFLASRARYRRHDRPESRSRDGLTAAAVAVIVLVLAVTELVSLAVG